MIVSLTSKKRLPPGKLGLPIVGQMFPFLKNPFQFIEDRIADYGPVFKTRIGRKTIVMAGPEACAKFIDPSLIQRAGAFPLSVGPLFGGKSLPFLDGGEHLMRKELVLEAFTPSALQSYLPEMVRIVESQFTQWSSNGEFQWLDGLKRVAFESICSNILMLGENSKLESLKADYESILAGLVALPGPTYVKALRAKARVFNVLRPIVKQRRESPKEDGVSRILAAKTKSGEMLSDDQAVLEIHHAIIAGYVIFAELAAIVLYATREKPVLARLQAEAKKASKGSPMSLQTLGSLHYVGQFVMEVKRLCPVIPAVFGKAKKDFEVYGVTVPKGWTVLWALRSSNIFRDSYTHRMRFDPERFSPPLRAQELQSTLRYAPQGGGPATGHRCAGLDYSTLLMEVFTLTLVRHSWRLKNINPDYNWSSNPPQPVDGLPARVI